MSSKILVVEDNLLNFELVRDILEYRGHQVEFAGTVSDARRLLHEAPPDLILLDVQVPGGGGIALLHELRGEPEFADIRVIAVTALAMDGDRERLLDEGFDGYLSKPIDTRSFGPTVEGFLPRGGAPHDG